MHFLHILPLNSFFFEVLKIDFNIRRLKNMAAGAKTPTETSQNSSRRVCVNLNSVTEKVFFLGRLPTVYHDIIRNRKTIDYA